jgi:hypothetical protein
MPGLEFSGVLGTRRFARLVGREAATSILETTRTFEAEDSDLRPTWTADLTLPRSEADLPLAAKDAH